MIVTPLGPTACLRACPLLAHPVQYYVVRANRLHNLESRPCRDTIEILEAEIQKSLEGRKSTIFSADAYYKLLRARRELCKLHGSDLPDAILAKFGTQMEAVTPQAWASAKRRISKEVLGNGNQDSSRRSPTPMSWRCRARPMPLLILRVA